MKRLKGKGFTLIELLVVIAIIALLISILLPSLSRARELSKRTVCAANLHGIGHALYIYAQDDPGTFPAISDVRTSNDGKMTIFNPTDRTTQPSTTGVPSPSVDMWALIRANNTSAKQFICPSTIDTPDPSQDPTAYYDFYRDTNLSYAYQFQHDPNRQVIGTSSEPTFPVMADANPYIKGHIGTTDIAADRTAQGRGNSNNHTNREGQNVLFQDAHANFEKGPDCGLSGLTQLTISRGKDHIYTVHGTSAQSLVDPGLKAPDTNNCDLGSKSDACLVP